MLGTSLADGSGNYSITATILTAGSHTLTVKATDTAGNVGVVSSGLTLAIDTSAPGQPAAPTLSAGSDSGTPGDDITNDTTPTVTGTAEAGSTVTLYDTDGTTVLGTGLADGSGNYSITSTILTAGSHTLTVKATDTAGNVGAASSGLTLAIDTSAPGQPAAPTLSAASDSGTLGDNITNDTTPTVTGTAEAGSTVTLYDTDGTTVLGTSLADGSGNYSITSTILTAGSPHADGEGQGYRRQCRRSFAQALPLRSTRRHPASPRPPRSRLDPTAGRPATTSPTTPHPRLPAPPKPAPPSPCTTPMAPRCWARASPMAAAITASLRRS